MITVTDKAAQRISRLSAASATPVAGLRIKVVGGGCSGLQYKIEMDAENPKHFSVACPDAAGNEVVIYHFEQTKTGWKFTGLDNLNE